MVKMASTTCGSRIGKEVEFVETVGLGTLRVISAGDQRMSVEITYDPTDVDLVSSLLMRWTPFIGRTTRASEIKCWW